MNIDSYSISSKNLIKIYNTVLYFVKKYRFLAKNVNIAIDLLAVFCYYTNINNNLYILSFYQFFIKKYIDFLKYMVINSSLTQSKYF